VESRWRNHERRAPAHQLAEPFLDHRFRFRVQARGGLIQDQDAWIGENRARDRYALALAAG
jgi:hypothetical protein